MRKVAVIALGVITSVFLAVSVMAESSARDECVALCKDAAKFMNEKGFYPTVAEINNKEGKFITKNTYVYMLDMDGHLLAHPFNQHLIGRDASGSKDKNGKLFNKESIAIAKTKGEGWNEYLYPKPEEMKKPTPYMEKTFSKKITYVYRVPGKDFILIAGYFE